MTTDSVIKTSAFVPDRPAHAAKPANLNLKTRCNFQPMATSESKVKTVYHICLPTYNILKSILNWYSPLSDLTAFLKKKKTLPGQPAFISISLDIFADIYMTETTFLRHCAISLCEIQCNSVIPFVWSAKKKFDLKNVGNGGS